MSSTDPRAPVIVGVGQVTQKTDDFDGAQRAADLMIEAVRLAADDADAAAIAGQAEAIGVVSGLWDYPDPGRLIAEAFGADNAKTALTIYSGAMAQHMLTEYASRIQSGDLDVAIVAGGEAQYSATKRGEQNLNLARVRLEDIAADEFFGEKSPLFSRYEDSLGFSLPIVVYPLFGSAVRAARGQSQDQHRDEISAMWADFSRVAAANPYAWDREPHTTSEIRDPANGNRMISWPYTRSMNANMFVDQAAAIIVCSNAKADELGIPLDRRVFPLAAADASDPVAFTERQDMSSSPAIRLCGSAALELAGVGIADVSHYDLYSCFPSIVQISTAELDVPAGMQLTQTGGLSLFGGPLNSYTLHGIASVAEKLREHPGEFGLVHGNGGHMSKQSICLYSTDPPGEFRKTSVQGDVDALPHRMADAEYEGTATIESCTVLFGKDGPAKGFATALTAVGNRVLGTTEDETLMEAFMIKEMIGEPANIDAVGELRF